MDRNQLASPFSEPPSEKMREAARAFQIPENFRGRVGALIVRVGDKEEILFETSPARNELFIDWKEVSAARLWPAFSEKDVPNVTLQNTIGEVTTLKDLIAQTLSSYPTRPLEQGGRAIELRKAFMRFALTDALNSPSVRLLRRFVKDYPQGTPIELAEWWAGVSPLTEVRHNGMFIAPPTHAKSLIEYLLRGIAHEKPRGVWHGSVSPALPILYEDDDILLTDKPAKLASVPGIREKVDAKTVLEKEKGPLYIVHRLDTDTSGLLLFAKNPSSLSFLSEAFRRKDVLKCYKARLSGELKKESGEITLPLRTNPMDAPRQCVISEACGGKPSRTLFELCAVKEGSSGTYSLVKLYPETGRTHQLRVHCAHAHGLGLPIEGDPFYGFGGLCNQVATQRLNLHASEITFPHPTKSTILHFETEAEFFN